MSQVSRPGCVVTVVEMVARLPQEGARRGVAGAGRAGPPPIRAKTAAPHAPVRAHERPRGYAASVVQHLQPGGALDDDLRLLHIRYLLREEQNGEGGGRLINGEGGGRLIYGVARWVV